MASLFLIDAFADRPFTGNPAAVCLCEAAPEEEWQAAMARELNQPATAFCWPEDADSFRLRWFAPARELELCGHATLATAHALHQRSPESGPIWRFQTRAGTLTAQRTADGAIALDFPLRVALAQTPPAGLIAALGVTPVWVGSNGTDWLVEAASEADVLAARPDFARLAAIPARAAMITARATRPDADFVSRFFAPAVGIPEDHVTGSAHCALLPHWADRLGQEELVGYQASARGGFVRVRRERDRARLIGHALVVAQGELR